MIRLWWLLWLCIMNFAGLYAQTFLFNENCVEAYHHIISLRLSNGAKMLAVEEQLNKNNLIPVYLQNYIDFLDIYVSDSRSKYETLKKNKELKVAQLSEGDGSSPYYLFTQAEVYLQWAAIELKFGDYVAAFFDIRRAYKMLELNKGKFPGFKPNDKSLGVLYALLGAVPDKYKWGVSLLGMEGNVDRGIKMLQQLNDSKENEALIYRHETVVYSALLMFHLQNKSDEAWAMLTQNHFPQPHNLMDVYVCAHIGVYGRHNDEALKILTQRDVDSAFVPFPYLTYLTALAKLNMLDASAAEDFKKFVVTSAGSNHIKSAFQKIAWCYLLSDDSVNYFHYIKKADKLGAAITDADKQAQQEVERGQVPFVRLLRARLLFDGGYFEKAANEMNRISFYAYITNDIQTEYLYRFGRIYHEWGKKDSALSYYEKAIDNGKKTNRYFAPNAAFECGRIFEERNDTVKAKYYYEMCLSFEKHEYKNGLDQKAKAALNRLK